MRSVKHPCAVTLRPAWPGEARALAFLSRTQIEHGLRWRYTPPRIAALMADPETSTVVACDAQGPRGFGIMQFGDEHAHLSLLAVHAALQRRGVGRQLMQWLLGSARVAGMATVQLELRADNPGALDFYRTLGFEMTVRVPGYYEGALDAWRMQLALR